MHGPTSPTPQPRRAVILGAGPAGLAAGLALTQPGGTPPWSVRTLEAGDKPGGMSRSIDFAGARADLGPHALGTDLPEIDALVRDTLGDRHDRITLRTAMLWNGRTLNYPPTLGSLARQVGPIRAARIALSVLAARLRPERPPANYREQAVRKYGRLITETCIEPYLRRLWGVDATHIAPTWTPGRFVHTRRLRRLLGAALRRNPDVTVIHPENGTGELYERLAERVAGHGAAIELGTRVRAIEHDGSRLQLVVADSNEGGETRIDLANTRVLSSIPLPLLLAALRPAPPEEVLGLARALRFRSTAIVYAVADPETTPRRHITYVNDDRFTLSRVTNFSMWSSGMRSPLGDVLCAEYWGDHEQLDQLPDDRLTRQTVDDLALMGVRLVDDSPTRVIRLPRSHPLITPETAEHLRRLTAYLGAFENLSLLGRAGSFVYADQDRVLAAALAEAKRLRQNVTDGS